MVTEKTFRYATWLRVTISILSVFPVMALVAGFQSSGWTVRLALFSISAVSFGALVEMVVSRIELRSDGLLIATLFKKRFIPRHEIQSVTWEAGCGVAVRLQAGKWAKLPDLGHSSQNVANSVRDWIRRGSKEVSDECR